jgi:hypothetical protein
MWAEVSKLSFVTVPIVGTLSGLFCTRTAFSTYKLVGSRFDGATFSWFYVALQSPWYAKQFWAQDDVVKSLPEELRPMAARARMQINYGIATFVLWTIFALCIGALAAHLEGGIYH